MKSGKSTLGKFVFAVIAGLLVVVFMQARVEFPQRSVAAPGDKLWNEKSAGDLKSASVNVELLNKVFIDLAASGSPTVVNIYTKTRIAAPSFRGYGGMAPDDLFRFFFGNPMNGGDMRPPARESQALGSGFVINASGLIVTNSHVVRQSGHNADQIMVRFLGDSPKSPGYEATVVGVDESTDVAVIKLKKKKTDLKEAPLGDSSKLHVGEWVAAIGNPYGHTHTFTKGVVSALGRSIEELEASSEFIQVDASINPGNSGGPLFNLYGEVVGINTAIDARAQGIGFAIPINTAKAVIRQLVEKGEVTLGWIGVALSDLSPQLSKSLNLKTEEGALIQDVLPGEPAAKAGLKSYDVVISVNEASVGSARDFTSKIRRYPVGSTVNLKVMRDGRPVMAKVVIGKRKSEAEVAAQMDRAQRNLTASGKKTGIVMSELPAERKRAAGVHGGVLVTGVIPGSIGADAGLAAGDIISEINRHPVENLKQAEAALASRGDAFLLKIQRGTASVIVLLDLTQPSSGGGGPGYNDDDQGAGE